jgi:hypothetical protein
LLGFFQDPEDLLLGVMLFHGPGGLVFHPALSLKPLQLQGSRSIDLAEFAIHARRVTEHCDLRGASFPNADASRFKFTVPPPEPIEKDYHEALNRLVHAKTYTIGHVVWDGPKIFLRSKQNLALGYVRIATDRRESACVSVFGVATCFLCSVIASVREKHPELQF